MNVLWIALLALLVLLEKLYSVRTMDRARSRRCMCRRGRLDVVIFAGRLITALVRQGRLGLRVHVSGPGPLQRSTGRLARHPPERAV